LNSAETNSAAAHAAAPEAARFDLLPIIWLAGVALQVLLLTRSAWTMRQSLRRARPLADPDALSLASECASALGICSRIQILESTAFGGPAIVGLWRPRLILPSGMAERLTAEELRFVLLHEYAHVRRHDLAVMWLMTAARVIHWFNPFAWLASRAMRIDTELACDETLLRHASPDAPVALWPHFAEAQSAHRVAAPRHSSGGNRRGHAGDAAASHSHSIFRHSFTLAHCSGDRPCPRYRPGFGADEQASRRSQLSKSKPILASRYPNGHRSGRSCA
jgi:hypothetical protein